MAILQNDEFKIEIKLSKHNDTGVDFIDYDFYFCYNNQPIFNSVALHDNPFGGEEFLDGDKLLPALEKAFNDNKSVRWEPMEPDMYIDIQPLDIKFKTGSHFILTFVIDEYNYLNEKDGYTGDGFAFRQTLTRSKMEKMIQDLKQEYKDLVKIGGVK